MVVVKVCPVHGAQQAWSLGLEKVIGVRLSQNKETCNVPGCRLLARVMDGNFNFHSNTVEVIAAPQWSISALKEVAPKLGQTIRILASPSTTEEEARQAVATVQPEVEKAVKGLPLPLSKKMLNALQLSPGESPMDWRKRVGLVLAVVYFLVLNYSGVKDNVAEMVDDAGQLVGWVSENTTEIPEWFDQVTSWLNEAHE